MYIIEQNLVMMELTCQFKWKHSQTDFHVSLHCVNTYWTCLGRAYVCTKSTREDLPTGLKIFCISQSILI